MRVSTAFTATQSLRQDTTCCPLRAARESLPLRGPRLARRAGSLHDAGAVLCAFVLDLPLPLPAGASGAGLLVCECTTPPLDSLRLAALASASDLPRAESAPRRATALAMGTRLRLARMLPSSADLPVGTDLSCRWGPSGALRDEVPMGAGVPGWLVLGPPLLPKVWPAAPARCVPDQLPAEPFVFSSLPSYVRSTCTPVSSLRNVDRPAAWPVSSHSPAPVCR